MSTPVGQRAREQGGFTLIELLTVILIIGVLAAIAIPSFLNQKGKANDAAAKSQARTAETAAETYATESNGTYKGLTEVKQLQAIEPTLNDATTAKLKEVAEVEAGIGYKVVSESVATKDTFTIERTKTGAIVRTCTEKGKNGCPASGNW